MPNVRLRLKTYGTAIEEHFQPEALNEVLNGFALKLTPMYRCNSLQAIHLLQKFLGMV
ncbi:MAG: hypothetical protein V7K21_09885 [Nostoc sp.]